MSTEDLDQSEEAWRLARAGSLGASSIADALARTRTGWGASRAQVLARLAVERLTGVPQDGFRSAAMLDGIAREPESRAAYQFEHGVIVRKVGLFRHPTIAGSHASPDGEIGEQGLLELKNPTHATHLETLLGAPVPQKYLWQCQWQLSCTGRAWVDLTSFHPAFPENMQLHTTRIHRDDKLISELEAQVREFLAELEAKLTALTSRYGMPEREAA